MNRNGMWKGDNVGYTCLHIWVRRHKPKPKLCERCHKVEPYEVANISGEYKRDINDFEWLCHKCHMKSDGRMKQFKERLKNHKGKGHWNWQGGISKNYQKRIGGLKNE